MLPLSKWAILLIAWSVSLGQLQHVPEWFLLQSRFNFPHAVPSRCFGEAPGLGDEIVGNMSVGARLRGRDYHPEPCAEGTFRDTGKEACIVVQLGSLHQRRDQIHVNDARLEGWLRIELQSATTAAPGFIPINRTVCMDCPIGFVKSRTVLETAENVPSVIRQIQIAAASAPR